MNDDMITVHGFVATDVNLFTSVTGVAMANFRMATTARRWDKESQKVVDAGTNWYNIKSYRYLAQNAGTSLHKGDPVVVTGKLVLRQWTSEDGKSGTSPDIEAVAMGHDLSWGTARFTRSGSQRRSSVNPEGEGQDASADLPSDRGEAGIDDPSNADDLEDAEDLDEELASVNLATGEILAAEVPY